MEEKEFISWLRGFTQGVHHYNLTPKQWDYLKEKLNTVNNSMIKSYDFNSKYWTITTTLSL